MKIFHTIKKGDIKTFLMLGVEYLANLILKLPDTQELSLAMTRIHNSSIIQWRYSASEYQDGKSFYPNVSLALGGMAFQDLGNIKIFPLEKLNTKLEKRSILGMYCMYVFVVCILLPCQAMVLVLFISVLLGPNI